MRNAAEHVVTDLVAAGLVERHRALEAERLVVAALQAEAASPGWPPRQSARTRLVEIAGYVGGALVLAAGGLLLAQLWTELSEPVQVAALTMIAVLLGGAGLAVLRGSDVPRAPAGGPDDLRRRLSSTLLTAASLAAALAVAMQASFVVDDVASEVPSVLGGVTMLVLTALGYRFAHSAVAVLAMAVAVVQVVVTALGDTSGSAAGLVTGAGLLAAAVAWLTVTERTGWFRERDLARSAGMALALAGAQTPLLDGGHDNVAYVLTAAVAGAGFLLYLRTAGWPYVVVGVAAVTVVVPEAVMAWTDSALGPAGAVLVAGVTLLAASLAGLRMRQEATEPGRPQHSTSW